MDTTELILATDLRAVVGERGKARAWFRLLPVIKQDGGGNYRYHLPSGSLLLEKYRGQSIRSQPWEKVEKYWSRWQKTAIMMLLTRDFGLVKHVARHLVDRPRTTLLRIEDFISGMVDSLWLSNEKIFLLDGPEYPSIKNLVRKIFAVGTYDLSALVSDWKQWGNNLFHTVARTQTIGSLEPVRYNNIFRTLDTISYIYKIRCSDPPDMLQLQHLAHLISSRQMPYMGLKTEIKSAKKFREVLQSDFKPSAEIKYELTAAARRIGGICRHIRRTPLTPGVCHISVTSSGELYHPASKGAQAAAVREAMVRILTRVPETDETEETPFGTVSLKGGLQIWKTLFRDEEIVGDHNLFDPITSGYPKGQPGRFWGLDKVTGRQVMYVAWKELSQLQAASSAKGELSFIPELRAEVVPEMGNKARFVTLSAYWLNVLQAPLAHLLKEAMKYHPSVFSSFHRQDQAWEAVRGLVRIKDISLDDQFVLSSDLTDATNAQQHELTRVMLRAFFDGYGLRDQTPYVNLVLGLIGPRLVSFRDGSKIVTKTGIMMGEAIAKPSLTLLNLAVEELAFLKYTNALERLLDDGPAPYRGWRYVHIGGDDHLVKGPKPYLDLITMTHRDAGSHITPGKHGYSRVCVKYTERVINLTNLQYRHLICEKDYRLSTIVDSVKVRLLERGQSTLIKKDNKNVAIGKSIQLMKVLKWLPKDRHFWPFDKIVSIRNLFINRMGALLPSKALHPRAYAAIHLPTIVGGYDLGFEEEYNNILNRSPEPTKWLLSKILLGANVQDDLKLFRLLNTNTSSRGIESIAQFEESIVEQLEKYPKMVNAITFRELREKFKTESETNARWTISIAAEEGFLSFREFAKRSVRGNLFQDLLMGKDIKVFNTRPFTSTYKYIWGECEDLGMDKYCLSEFPESSVIAKAIKGLAPDWFFDINQETSVDVAPTPNEGEEETYDFQQTTYRQLYTEGFPELSLGKKFCGVMEQGLSS